MEKIINLLKELRPNYGDVGTRDVDVRKKQEQIDEAISILSTMPVGEVVVTKNLEGEILAVTRQDEDGQIMKIISLSSPNHLSLVSEGPVYLEECICNQDQCCKVCDPDLFRDGGIAQVASNKELCFCDSVYPGSNPDASCGDCPTRDYRQPQPSGNAEQSAWQAGVHAGQKMERQNAAVREHATQACNPSLQPVSGADGLDAIRAELIADTREVFDAHGSETPQCMRDVIEYVDSWLSAFAQKQADSRVEAAQHKPSGNAGEFESWITKHCDYDDLNKSEIELARDAWQAAIKADRKRILTRIRNRQIAGAMLTEEVREIVAEGMTKLDDQSRGEPVAYAVFSDSGNIRIWCADPIQAETLRQEYGDQLRALYTAPQPAEPVKGPSDMEIDRWRNR